MSVANAHIALLLSRADSKEGIVRIFESMFTPESKQNFLWGLQFTAENLLQEEESILTPEDFYYYRIIPVAKLMEILVQDVDTALVLQQKYRQICGVVH